MNELAERAMRSGRRIGLVLSCLHGGEQRVVGFGQVRTGTKDRPNGATLFEIGSVTKVFTGLLLADLAEQGLVGLDDPLAGYLPAWVRVPIRGAHQLPPEVPHRANRSTPSASAMAATSVAVSAMVRPG